MTLFKPSITSAPMVFILVWKAMLRMPSPKSWMVVPLLDQTFCPAQKRQRNPTILSRNLRVALLGTSQHVRFRPRRHRMSVAPEATRSCTQADLKTARGAGVESGLEVQSRPSFQSPELPTEAGAQGVVNGTLRR